MTYTLKNLTDIDENSKFHKFIINNPNYGICYGFFNNDSKCLYVGATNQIGTKKINYLKNHHKMGKLESNFSKNIKVNIYLKYTENLLIKFFKPEYNKIGGSLCSNYRNEIDIIDPHEQTLDDLYLHKLELFKNIKTPTYGDLLKRLGFTSKNIIGLIFIPNRNILNYICKDEYDEDFIIDDNLFEIVLSRFESNKNLYIFENKNKNDQKKKLLLDKINNIKNSIGNKLPNFDNTISNKLSSIINECNSINSTDYIYKISNFYLLILEKNTFKHDHNFYRNVNEKFESTKLLLIFENKNDKEIKLLLDNIYNIKNSIGNKLPYHDIIIPKKLLSIIYCCDSIYFKECMKIILNSYYEFFKDNIKKNIFKCSCGKRYSSVKGLCKHFCTTDHSVYSGGHELFFSYQIYLIICNNILYELNKKKYLSKNLIKSNRVWGAYMENINCTIEDYETQYNKIKLFNKILKNKHEINFYNLKIFTN